MKFFYFHFQTFLRLFSSSNSADNCLPLPAFSEEHNIFIINAIKSIPQLWNYNTVGYRLLNQRESALIDLQAKIKENIQQDIKEVDLWRVLNAIFKAATREKRARIEYKEHYKPFYACHEELKFLDEFVPPHYCDICQTLFKDTFSYDSLKVHKAKHNGVLPFECFFCERRLSERAGLEAHLRIHVQDLPYACEHCDFKAPTKSALTVHNTKHTGIKKYCCEQCGLSYRSATIFSMHKRRVHATGTPFHCHICPKSFKLKFYLTTHLKSHTNVKDVLCTVCGKAFGNKKLLRQHRLIHDDYKRYECKICNKRFAQHAGYYCHMKSHTVQENK